MKSFRFNFFSLFRIVCIGLVLNFVSCSQRDSGKQAILKLLPKSHELENWKTSDTPQYFKGDDLFFFINGGADIYHEYGFRQVVAHSYENGQDKSINLEIYEMEDSTSAYGIYTFKTGREGRDILLGSDSLLEEYYLNFWKGTFCVTIIGFDSDEETINGLLQIGKTIDTKIQKDSEKPALIQMLPEKGLLQNSVVYFQGISGWMNQNHFLKDQFYDFDEGVIGYYGAYSILFFRYQSTETAEKWYEKIKESNTFIKTKPKPIYMKRSNDLVGVIYGISKEQGKKLFQDIPMNVP